MTQLAVHVDYPAALKQEVDDYLWTLRFSQQSRTSGLEDAMRYSLLAGGKRLRPVLALGTAKTLGMTPREVLPLAAAIELIHTFSLIHDDLPAMDDDDERRGRPACHRVHGEGIAILAGDALLAEAFCLLLGALRGPAANVLRAALIVARAAGATGMAGGQYIDLARRPTCRDALVSMHRLKTGALIEASVLSVLALAGGTDKRLAGALTTYASELGLMFQVVDDILDAEDDARHGRPSTATTGGVGAAVRLADEHYRRIGACLESVPTEPGDLTGIAAFARHRMV